MTDTALNNLDMTHPGLNDAPPQGEPETVVPQIHTAGSSLGERLRQARLDAQLTLDSAAGRTRIKRDYLEALEAMDPRGLPSRAYCVGYLRTYAGFLGLDAAACVDQFKAELEVDTGRATPTAPQERREIKLPRGMIGTVVILIAVVVAATWYGDYASRSQAQAGTPAALDALMDVEAPLVDTRTLPSSALEDIWAGLPTSTSPNGLVFEAAGPVTLVVRDASGRILADRTLDPGGVYRAPDEPGLTVSASDAGAILVRAGGRPLGALGESGEAVDNVPAASFVIEAMRQAGE